MRLTPSACSSMRQHTSAIRQLEDEAYALCML